MKINFYSAGYLKKLKNIFFLGLPRLDYEKVFRQNFFCMEHYGFHVMSFKEYIREIFFQKNQYDFKRKGESQLLFFLGIELVRNNWLKQINYVASLFDSYNTCYRKQCIKKRDLLQGVILFFYSIIWLVTLLFYGFSKIEARIILYKLQNLYFFYKEIKKLITNNKIKILIVLNDALLHDAFLIECFRKANKKTISLQHGFFSAPRAGVDLVNVSGIEFLSFHSDYFLVWNRATVIEATAAGIPLEKIRICGLLEKSYSKAIVANNSKKIGVLLSGKDLHKRNIQILTLARKLAINYGYSIILRPHPQYNQDEFNDYLDLEKGDSLSSINIPLENYASSVEFTILGNSSAFLELMNMLHPIYQYHDLSNENKFPKHSYSFSSYEELEMLFEKRNIYNIIDLKNKFLPLECSEVLYKKNIEDIMKK